MVDWAIVFDVRKTFCKNKSQRDINVIKKSRKKAIGGSELLNRLFPATKKYCERRSVIGVRVSVWFAMTYITYVIYMRSYICKLSFGLGKCNRHSLF